MLSKLIGKLNRSCEHLHTCFVECGRRYLSESEYEDYNKDIGKENGKENGTNGHSDAEKEKRRQLIEKRRLDYIKETTKKIYNEVLQQDLETLTIADHFKFRWKGIRFEECRGPPLGS